jgi:hypothetical protein
MTSTAPDREAILKKIEKGMTVYDSNGKIVGTVEFVHFSEANGSHIARGASLPDDPVQPNVVDLLGKVFGSDDLPEEIRKRLLMHGFVKVDSAFLFGADRYVMPDQIAKVDEKKVHLRVQDSEGLVKK